jgi:hypothetical protein
MHTNPQATHECRPPTALGRRIENDTWTCSECGAPWHVEPRRSSNSAYVLQIMTEMGPVDAEWVRGTRTLGRLNGSART